MEYINGSTLSLHLMSQPISLTYKIIDEIIEFILIVKVKIYQNIMIIYLKK